MISNREGADDACRAEIIAGEQAEPKECLNDMKIAVVIPKYGLVGGAEAFVYEVCERLAAGNEFQIHVFANQWRRGRSPIVFHKIPIVRFPKFLGPISFAHFARRQIQKHDFDLLHSHERIFEMDLFTFHGIPHRRWIEKTRTRPLSLFDRATSWVEEKGFNSRRLRLVMPVSSLAGEELLKAYPLSNTRVRVRPPGVDVARFAGLDPAVCRREVRVPHGLSVEDVVVLFVSMNFELKRLDLVLRGVARVAARSAGYSPLKVLVVGKGDAGRFKALARDLGISDRVVFAGVTREIEKYYLAGDIFAMPSRFDTFGLAVLEAMAAGLPVIVSRTVGACDLVAGGENGFVLSENPADSEMEAALAALIEPGERTRMGEKARRVAAGCSWDKVAEEVAGLYRKLSGGWVPNL